MKNKKTKYNRILSAKTNKSLIKSSTWIRDPSTCYYNSVIRSVARLPCHYHVIPYTHVQNLASNNQDGHYSVTPHQRPNSVSVNLPLLSTAYCRVDYIYICVMPIVVYVHHYVYVPYTSVNRWCARFRFEAYCVDSLFRDADGLGKRVLNRIYKFVHLKLHDVVVKLLWRSYSTVRNNNEKKYIHIYTYISNATRACRKGL